MECKVLVEALNLKQGAKETTEFTGVLVGRLSH